MDGAQCARAHEFTTGLILTQTLAMQITNLETVFCRFPSHVLMMVIVMVVMVRMTIMLIVFIAEFMFISFYIHPHFFLDLLCAICLLVCMLLLLFLSICTEASWLARMICASIQGTNFGNDCVNPARMLCVIPVFLLPSCNRRWQRNTHITHHLQMMFRSNQLDISTAILSKGISRVWIVAPPLTQKLG